MDLENEGLEAPVDETIVDAAAGDSVAVDENVDTGLEPVASTSVVDDKPKTMEDTIREALRAKTVDENANKPGWVKDPKTGRFVEPPKSKPVVDKKASVAKLGADGKPVVEPVAKLGTDGKPVAKLGADGKPAAEVKPVVDPNHEKSPTSWGKAAQEKYPGLDPAVKAMVHQREVDFHKGLEQYKGLAQVGQTFHAEFQPYEALIRASGHTPQTLIRNWMNAEYQLKTGTPEQKAALFLNYAQAYGVDLTAVQAAAAKVAEGKPVTVPVDPRVAALEQRLAQTETVLTTQQKAAAEQMYNGIVAETQAFGQRPENKYFEDVKLQMAEMMEKGQAESLQDAYNKAIWLNTDVRAKMLSEQAAEQRKQAADKAAAARKAAGANVATRGTLPSAPAKAVSGTTMEDTIKAQLRAIQARTG